MQKACDGTFRRRSNTKKCGDLRVHPSNLHYCRPISGRQHESAVGRDTGFLVSRWESKLFRAFSVREDGRCDGRARSSAPRVVLRFEGLKNRFRTFRPELESPAPKAGSKNSTRGAVSAAFRRARPDRATKMRGHDGAADIHRSQTRSQVLRTHQGSRRDAEPHRGSEGVLRPVPDGR